MIDFVHHPSEPFIINRRSPQARGLVAVWPLMSNSLFNLIDGSVLTANGGTGTYPGLSASIAPIIRSWSFDASNSQYLYISSNLGIAAYPFSMSCWFRPNPATNYDSLMWIGASGATGQYISVEVANDTLKTVNLEVKQGASLNVGSSNTYTNYEWHHVAIVVVGDNERHVYLDGVKTSDTTAKSALISGYDSFAVGMARDASPRGPYDGAITDVRVHNIVLTAEDVALMWNPMTRFDLYRTYPILFSSLATKRVPRHGFVNYQLPGVM